jgi:hypothetical protein
MIGGNAPSKYLEQLRNHEQVAISESEQDAILKTHLIHPETLRNDDFNAFYEARKRALLSIVEKATGKSIIADSGEVPIEDGDD